jgi:hypothetical protein
MFSLKRDFYEAHFRAGHFGVRCGECTDGSIEGVFWSSPASCVGDQDFFHRSSEHSRGGVGPILVVHIGNSSGSAGGRRTCLTFCAAAIERVKL